MHQHFARFSHARIMWDSILRSRVLISFPVYSDTSRLVKNFGAFKTWAVSGTFVSFVEILHFMLQLATHKPMHICVVPVADGMTFMFADLQKMHIFTFKKVHVFFRSPLLSYVHYDGTFDNIFVSSKWSSYRFVYFLTIYSQY